MVTEIRIYVEGGGNDKFTWRKIREGFGQFLDPLRQLARSRRVGWSIIPCGPGSETLKEFMIGSRRNPDAFNILLVDSESQVVLPRREHLRQQAGWDVSLLSEDQCHFMAQTVEAWIIADPDSLAGYYGQHFRRSVIPGHSDIEAVSKEQLLSTLKRATEKTQKGPYTKIRHCADLLGRLNRDRVRQRAAHCDLLFRTLEARLGG
ncbi:MAG TPA: DUF4276 family protein [Thermoanaerobaculia bacterium]|jgi:hypothetical protein|nr:DUF4276 family protein [Thermoanaerobaculia bacterium]